MNIRLCIFIFSLFSVISFGQIDSIAYQIKYAPQKPIVTVEQTMKLYRTNIDSAYYFYVWSNAYKDNRTVLNEVKLNQRNDDFHFSDLVDRGWVEELKFYWIGGEERELKHSMVENELVKVFVPKSNVLNIRARYKIHLPSERFTGYGIEKDGSLLLKYFFIQPEIRNNGVLIKQSFKDLESLMAKSTNYCVHFDMPDDYEIYTDLKRRDINEYTAKERDFFQIAIQKKGTTTNINTLYGNVVFDRVFPEEEEVLIRKAVLNQLNFLRERLGALDEPLFVSEKKYRKNRFQGIQDIKIPFFNKEYKIFSAEDRIKLEMIVQLIDAYVERKIVVNMQKEHWLRNGLAHYFLLEYLETEFPDLKLAGNIIDDFRLWGIKPLKLLDASEIKMSDRSKWFYRLLLQSNLDQAIDTPYDKLNNFNKQMISSVKAGLSIQYLSEYVGENEFNRILKEWIGSGDSILTSEGFKIYLENNLNKSVDWFFGYLIENKNWYDIGIAGTSAEKDSLIIKIKNRGNVPIPFKLTAYSKESVTSKWIQNINSKFEIKLPKNNYEKLVINDSIKLPDFNLKNDEYNPNSFFKRKIKFGLVTDIPKSGEEKIFLLPSFSWNNYDKLQVGLSIGNQLLLSQEFVYDFKPKYSVGENDFTGSFSLNWNKYPDKIFRLIRISANGGYQHYNRGLAYRSLDFGLIGEFNKKLGSTRNRGVYIYYKQIDREVRETATKEEQELRTYGLLNLGYNYWNTNVIHNRKGLVNLQIANTFTKISGEYYYRWKYGRDKTIGVRLFGGAFLDHDLSYSEYFDFGLDRITDYNFNYPLLGRSELQGILSQQFVLAEGGFKSNFHKKSNQFLFATNIEIPIWKILDTYVDFGFIKNKQEKGEFLYDTGIRLQFIPDFFEFYFPIQSSLGFEPSLGEYHKRIRFMLKLDFKVFRDYWKSINL